MATPVELLPSLPNQEPLDPALSESHHGVSWPILSSSLAQALFKLKESIQLGNTPEFSHQVTDIVHRIRFLLYVSGCLDKDTSVYLKSNKQLRNYHRTLLATIAKLVLSAKVASGTHSHEARIKLQIDTDEVLAAIREFMTCAQDMQLEIHESKPSLIYTGLPPPPKNISTNGNRLNTANPEAIATFAEHTKTALHSLMDNLFSTFSHFQRGDLLTTLDRLKVNAPLLVAQFRNLSNTTSHFLNFIEQVCQVQLPVERVTALTASKQPIYSAMGSLFIISQIITNSEIDGKQLEEIWANLEECTRTIEASIQDCVDIVKMKLQPPPPPQLPSTPMPTVPPEEQFYQQQKHQKTSSTLGSMASHRSRHESDKSGFVRKQDDGEDAESDIDENVNGVHVYSDQELDEFDDEDDDDLSIENEIGNVRPKTELKIFKFFGEDTIAAARRRDTTMLSPTASSAASIMTGGNLTLNNSVVNEVPWYMTSDIEPGDLIMNMEGNVKGGTLATLIKKLTQHDQLGKVEMGKRGRT
jgi:son of sevenless-like protein